MKYYWKTLLSTCALLVSLINHSYSGGIMLPFISSINYENIDHMEIRRLRTEGNVSSIVISNEVVIRDVVDSLKAVYEQADIDTWCQYEVFLYASNKIAAHFELYLDDMVFFRFRLPYPNGGDYVTSQKLNELRKSIEREIKRAGTGQGSTFDNLIKNSFITFCIYLPATRIKPAFYEHRLHALRPYAVRQAHRRRTRCRSDPPARASFPS